MNDHYQFISSIAYDFVGKLAEWLQLVVADCSVKSGIIFVAISGS
jgi:hypothetical protein